MSVSYQSEAASGQVSLLLQGDGSDPLGVSELGKSSVHVVADGRAQPTSARPEAAFLLEGKEFRVCPLCPFHPSILYPLTCLILSGA